MINLFTILFFIIGLSIGSFLNVVIFRIDDLRSIWKSRSHCMNCKKILSWYDLIPFFSFVLLKTKCRYCGTKISWQYPIVEIGTALVFVLLYLTFGISWALIFYLIVFSLLIVVFVIDLKTQMTPETFVWAALILTILGGWYFGGFGFLNMIYGALVGGGLLAILVYVSGEKWMGAGDIKIGLILGALTGYPVAFFGLFLAFILGAVVGLIYIKLRQKTIKESLPFAPFLIFSTLAALIFGNAVVNWYLGAFLF